MTDDSQAQDDELLALASIYDSQIFSTSEDVELPGGQFSAILDLPKPFEVKTYKIDAAEKIEVNHSVKYLPPITLYFQFPLDYPSLSPPTFTLSCKWLTLQQLSILCSKLDQIWEENHGMEVLFLWTSFLKDDVCEFLDVRSPMDLSNVVLSRTKRWRLSRGISTNSDASSHSKEERAESASNKNSDFASCHNVDDAVGNSQLKTRADSQDTVAGVSVQEAGVSSDRACHQWMLDPRAIQDIASQDLLYPAVVDYDKTQQEYVFQMTLFTCQVCFGEKLGTLCLKFTGCDHVYCKECMKGYFEVQISEGDVQNLTCPSDKCDSQAYPAQVQELVDHNMFSRYDRLLLQSSLDTMSDIMYCPRPSCRCAVMVDQDSCMGTCPVCHFVFCIFCKWVYHGVSPCKIKADEIRKLREQYVAATEQEKKMMERRYGRRSIQLIVEDSCSQEWLDSFSKKCPSCGTHIQKIDGCNKMTCTKCRCYFCWLCNNVLSRNNPYLHFNSPNTDCYNQLFHGVNMNDDSDEEFDDLDLMYDEMID